MNEYYEKIKFVKSKILSYLNEIYKSYDYALLLSLGGCNLLDNPYNCIESSTATGFLMEEFVVTKLEKYTRDHNGIDEIKIERIQNHGTQQSSYDCYTMYQNVMFMINVKVQKKGSANNAVAAINILHNDYVITNPKQEKAFLLLKTKYEFGESLLASERRIMTRDVCIYALEEVDFSSGHKQDHRNWSEVFNPKSGRLQVSDVFRSEHKMNPDEISYSQTKGFIERMFSIAE